MGIIAGGPVIEDAVPRHINPFGATRRVPSGTTIQSVVDVAEAGDVIYINPGTYAENVVITTAGLTLVGIGARGQPWINPATGIGLYINGVDDIVVVNLGIAGASGAAAALRITSASECRFYGCKIEGSDGPTTLTRLDGGDSAQCSNLMFIDCEWAWGTVGVEFHNSSYGYPTQIKFKDCLFHNVTTVHMRGDVTGGAVVDLWVEDCTFAGNEGGGSPTDFLVLDHADDAGMFTRNSFHYPTNEADVFTIGATVLWVGNYTEAGITTARPS